MKVRSIGWLLAIAGCATTQTETVVPAPASAASPLIARELLFGNPDKAAPRLSPDGEHLSWLAPSRGVLNVWVAPADDIKKARVITVDGKRGIRVYFWAYDNAHIVYLQDRDGDENWRVYAVDVATGTERDLTPLEGVRAEIVGVSREQPGAVIIGLNDRDPKLHDLYRIDLESGERTLVQHNHGFAYFVLDDAFRVRFAARKNAEGGTELLASGAADATWQPFMTIGFEDDAGTSPIDFDKTGQVLYLRDSRGRDTSALVALDLVSGVSKVLAEDPQADLGRVLVHPTEKTIQAASFTWTREQWQVLDDTVAADLAALRQVADGDVIVGSRTLADTRWVVAFVADDGPTRYYLYERATKSARFLFTDRPELEGAALARMHPVVIPARDGLELVSYLTLPRASDPDGDGKPASPVPLVLYVHGGPWGRDSWGLNPTHQWLANRGYAVLSVNFRASVGFGKRFVNAGNLEWAGKMHDDLLDAVAWAVAGGVAAKDQICIMGGSYGGYATLVGLTFTPDTFACGVDIVGPSNLETLLASIPPYWAPVFETFAKRMGDPRTEEGRKLLAERSPLTRVAAINKPLLIGQGANDPRVKQAESDQIVRAMQERNIPVTYVLFSDEGHGFARPENRLAFYAVAEHFLARQLGGVAEPVGDDLRGSSITVPQGVGEIPALADALARQGAPAAAK